ncbi:UNKNOWN [Stylonychia lemnae]|uniref:Cyclic nucleotide-binding domain-containing protein n=1 Tax=Stylonychia lemnae TaxID=5949 RepID=A0A078B593_STYLE|nr:UNKNOWN [Stylonychia lemnae]|eukprot:CDW89695.1 UNKNOWN [Stylonychia lemnae]
MAKRQLLPNSEPVSPIQLRKVPPQIFITGAAQENDNRQGPKNKIAPAQQEIHRLNRSKFLIERKNYKANIPKQEGESQTSYIYNMMNHIVPFDQGSSLLDSFGSSNPIYQLGSYELGSYSNRSYQELLNQENHSSNKSLIKLQAAGMLSQVTMHSGNIIKDEPDKQQQQAQNEVAHAEQNEDKYAMLKLDNRFLTYWNILIVVMATYDVFHIPYIIGFSPYYSHSYQIEINDYIIMFTYLIDIFVKFRTIYFDEQTGQKTFVPQRVAKLRLKEFQTYLDIIAFIPFTKLDKTWIPNEDFIYKATLIFEKPNNYSYWVTMYYSAMLFSISEAVPSETSELAFTSLMMIATLMIVTNFFGLIAGFVAQMKEKDQAFGKQMDVVNTAISNLELSLALKEEIAYYMVQMSGTQDEQLEFQSFIDTISPSNRKLVQEEIFRIAIKQNEMLQMMSDQKKFKQMLEDIVQKLEISLHAPENEIIKQGSDDPENQLNMYFVQRGVCQVFVNDKVGLDSGVKRVRLLYPGDHFGEVSLIYNCRRSASVIAGNYCTLASLSAQNFKYISMKYPKLVQEMKEQIFAYDDDIKVFMESNLKKISYMQNLDDDIFHEILFNFKQETYDRDTLLTTENEKSRKLFIVKNGIIDISISIDGHYLVVERLYRGSVLNPRAFLVGDISDIRAKCCQTQTLFYMTFDQMKKLSMKSQKLDQEITAIKNQVPSTNKDNPFIIDYILCKSVLDQSKYKDSKLENRRNMLTCQLKNAVLVKLTNLKRLKNKMSFAQIIQLIIKKKIEEKKQINKMGVLTNLGNAIQASEIKFEDLDSSQAAEIINLIQKMQEKYDNNFKKLQEIDKLSKSFVGHGDQSYHDLVTPKNHYNTLRPTTPKFSK